MEFTRRYYAVAALVCVLAAVAVVVDRPFPLLGAAGLGAWLLAHQVRFVRRARRTADSLSVDVVLSTELVTPDRSVPVVVEVTADGPVPLDLSIVPGVPPGARPSASPDAAAIAVGETVGRIPYPVLFPIAGTYRFDPVRIDLADAYGLFSTTVERGPRPEVTVQPAANSRIRVGRSGEATVAFYGDNPGQRDRRGLEPLEVRPYQPGDQVSRIDWRATARTGDLHVREYNRDTSGTHAALVVDRRPAMAVGPPGETMLDHARAVALSLLSSAARDGNRCSLYLVDEDAVAAVGRLSADGENFPALRTSLLSLSTDGAAGSAGADSARGSWTPEATARRLSRGGTAFERGLAPFFVPVADRRRAVAADPLGTAIRAWREDSSPPRETFLVTADADRSAVREAVVEATQGEGTVTVLLTPRVLFEPGQLGDLDRAFDRYRDFDAFRRSLERVSGVSALEVGPGDRIDTILAAGTPT